MALEGASGTSDGAVKSNAGDFATDDGATDWDAMWSRGIERGQAFDCSRTEPAFERFLSARAATGRGASALVPGCGRGYALASLARAGYEVCVGLEISNTARASALEHLKTEDVPSTAVVEVMVEDFFAFAPEEKFDLCYDCTFLCAIDPRRREEWARVYANCVKPGGILVSVVFPCGDFEGGPPYALTPEIVRDLLAPVGFEEVSLEETPAELYARGRLEYLHVFKRSAKRSA
jgi:SAM-dependent methyltransferase